MKDLEIDICEKYGCGKEGPLITKEAWYNYHPSATYLKPNVTYKYCQGCIDRFTCLICKMFRPENHYYFENVCTDCLDKEIDEYLIKTQYSNEKESLYIRYLSSIREQY